jgi:murein DD-endopeptidase MepM/ murein hydrolase activator NlpD
MMRKYFFESRKGRGILTLVALCFSCGCATLPGTQLKPPSFQVDISNLPARPGHALRVSVRGDDSPARYQVEGFSQSFALQSAGDTLPVYAGFFTVPLEEPAGAASVTITATMDGQTLAARCVSLAVEPREPFKITRLRLKNFNSSQYDIESKIMAEARAQSPGYPGKVTLTAFEWPVRGRITEVFGTQRIYNNGAGAWYHGGLDIAAPGGTTITAPSDGVVIFTAPFRAHGNTVLVDHGFGVITSYLHQRTIYVKPGDLLHRGQAIGEVGTTGGSTGNHLHFQINIHSQITSPWDFLSPL